jgi:hypothetical protein
MRKTWDSLPADLRKNSHNLSAIRVGVVGYAVLIVLYVAQIASSTDPATFASRIISFSMLLTLVGLVAAAGILLARTMMLAPRFIEAYCELLPDHAEDIRRIYAERGSGDVVAPWIRGKPGRFGKLLRGLAKRYSIIP